MKIPCSVTRDLLPLYKEKMVETETAELIQEHLESCSDCRQKLEDLETDNVVPVKVTEPLKSLKKEIQRRRWYTAIIAALCVFVAVFTYFYHEGSMKLIPWEDGLIEIQGTEARSYDEVFGNDGTHTGSETPVEVFVIRVDSRLNGFQESSFEDDDGSRTLILEGWSSNQFNSSTKREYNEHVFSPVPDRLMYWGGGEQKLLWGEPMNGGVEVLPRLALSFYVIVAAIVAVLSGIVWFFLRKRQQSWIPRQIFFAPVCYLAAHFLLIGIHTTSFFMERDFLSIVLITAALYIVVTLSWQLWLRHRKEA